MFLLEGNFAVRILQLVDTRCSNENDFPQQRTMDLDLVFN
jgi:hypothetical protein